MTVPATRTSGPEEFTRCEVPAAIRVARELDNGQWRTNRYLALGGTDLMRMVPPPSLATGKNPEGVARHGPLIAQNCTPGQPTATQTLRLRLRTEDFFASDVGDHLAFGLRAFYPTANRDGEEAYDAIGAILHRRWGGLMGERYRRPGGNDVGPADGAQVALQDGTTYLLEMTATTSQAMVRLTVEATGESTGWKTYVPPAGFAPLQGTGFLIAVLCQDDNARCEAYDRPFRIDLWDLVVGWS